ncbi:MAG: amidase [Lautropia sp.]
MAPSSLPPALAGAVETVAAIAEGRHDATELAKACLERIDALEPAIGAWTCLDPAAVLAQAASRDEARRRGDPLGALHGVPVAIKDNIDTEDLPTEDGTVLHAGRRPDADATLVARLRAAGAIVMGKSVTTEFAYFTPGKTRNPHDPARTPGGSSSGSAAAVASAMVPLAIGTQTNGSVIRPAAFCGVVGFKPSFGLISRHGVLRTSRRLDQIGVFARSVDDAALLAECLIGVDAGDPDTRGCSAPDLVRLAASEPPLPPTLGLLRSTLSARADRQTTEAFDELAEALGARISVVDLGEGVAHVNAWLATIMRTEIAFNLQQDHQRGADRMSERLLRLIDAGRATSATDYLAALALADRYAGTVAELFTSFDALVLPSAPGPAPLGLDSTGDPVFCSFASLLGLPAISLPLLQSEEGLPIGVQLVGAHRQDGRLLRTANWLVRTLGADATAGDGEGAAR